MISDNDIKEKAYKYSVEKNPRFTKLETNLSVTVSNMLEEAYYQGYRAAIADAEPKLSDQQYTIFKIVVNDDPTGTDQTVLYEYHTSKAAAIEAHKHNVVLVTEVE